MVFIVEARCTKFALFERQHVVALHEIETIQPDFDADVVVTSHECHASERNMRYRISFIHHSKRAVFQTQEVVVEESPPQVPCSRGPENL